MSLFRPFPVRFGSKCRCLCLASSGMIYRTNVAALPVSGRVSCERSLFLPVRIHILTNIDFLIGLHFLRVPL